MPANCLPARRAAGPASPSAAETRDEVEDPEDLGAVADHLPVAGLAPAQDAVAIDHEGGAPGDVAVRVEDPVRPDGPAMQVAQQGEGELLRGGERRVTRRAVATDRDHGCAALVRSLGDLDEVGEFRRSDAAPVEAVEDEHELAPSKIGEPCLAAAGGGQGEFWSGLAKAQAGHGVAVYPSGRDGVCSTGGPMKDSDTYRKGAEMRRRLLGDAFVDRSTKTVYADPVMGAF